MNGFWRAKKQLNKPITDFRETKRTTERLAGLIAATQRHDLRPTIRTHLSSIPIQELVRELVIAHSKPRP
ncbi:MAG: hypothetical protein ACXWLZ_09565, partial [Rhizomicrobium sp.]